MFNKSGAHPHVPTHHNPLGIIKTHGRIQMGNGALKFPQPNKGLRAPIPQPTLLFNRPKFQPHNVHPMLILGLLMHYVHLNWEVHLTVPDHSWYMDSGASSHITANPGMIHSPLSFSPSNTIFVGNGQCLPIHGSGNSFHKLPNKTYILKDIHYSPNIIKNLLSVRKFTRDNLVSMEFDPFGFSLKDLKTGKTLFRHNSFGDLYKFSAPQQVHTIFVSDSVTPRWHNRLGHPGAQVLDFLSRNFIIPCNKHQTLSICHSCQIANSQHLPFYDSPSYTFAPFDIIHCDLWTSPSLSNTGFKYYMVLMDNYTQYVWVYPLKYKSDTCPTFVKFHQLIFTQFNRKIQTFQCDGGEFNNSNFHNFAKTHGFVFWFSCPHTSPQNGKAERMIRRLNNIIRSLLFHAHLPPKYWVEALHTSAYLHNILPVKRLRFKTPTFALYNCKPTYEFLVVFVTQTYRLLNLIN